MEIKYKNENFKHLEFKFDELKREKEDNQENYKFTLSFASPEPYLRWFGYEIIDLEKMNLSRLNNNAVLLFNHDRNKVVGVVEKAWVDLKENKAFAEIRFDNNEESVKIKNSVENGILSKVSFGYTVDEIKWIEEKDNIDTYKVSTTPFEISIVSIPADDTVSINKKDFFEEKNNFNYNNFIKVEKKEKIMDTTNVEVKQEQQAQVQKTSCAKDIAELGALMNERELALKFIEEEKSLDDFKAELKAKREKSAPRILDTEIKQESIKTEKTFGEMIKDLSNNKSQASFRDFNGIKVVGKGKELATQHFSEILSNTIDNNVISKMGYNIIRNVVGDVYNFRGITEVEAGTHTTEEDIVIDSKVFKSFNYKAVKGRYSLPIKYSYDLLKQSAENIENAIINEGLKQLYNDLSDKLLATLINDSAVKVHSPSGASFSYEDVIKIQNGLYLQAGVAGSYVATNKTLNDLKLTQKFSGTNGEAVYNGSTLDSKTVVNVPKLPTGVTNEFLLFGDFSKFGVILDDPEIFINTYPDSKDQFEVKFIVSFGAVLTSPIAVQKSSLA